MRRLLIILLCGLLARQPAWALCAIDASVANVDGNSSTLTLSTIHAPDVIILIDVNGAHIGHGPTTTVSAVTDTAGLHYTRRFGSNLLTLASGTAPTGWNTEYWWTEAPAPLTNDVITVTWNAGDLGYNPIFAIAVNGATNPGAPWDGGLLPAAADNTTFGAPTLMQIPSVTTVNAGFALVVCSDIGDDHCAFDTNAGSAVDLPPGFTGIWGLSLISLLGNMGYNISYNRCWPQQSGAPLTYWAESRYQWLVVADVIDCPPPCGLPPRSGGFPFVWIHE